VRGARAGRRVARGAFLPTLSATSVLSRSDASTSAPFSAITDQDSYGGGLAASLDLLTGGRRGAELARTDAEARAAEAELVADRYAVVLGAKRAYFEVLRAGELVRVAEARIARAELGLRIAERRQRAGTATRSDRLRAQLELTGGRTQLNAARDTLQSAAYALGRLVGANGPVGARAPSSLDPRPLSLPDSAIVALAVREAPAVRAAAAAAEAGRAATRSARSQYFPSLKLTGGYLWANRSPMPGALRPGWTLSLGASLPLFNGFVREDALTRAAAAADVADVVEADARREARAEANRLLGALRLAREGIGLAEDAVASAREDLRVQTERYEAGLSTMLDALTSQAALVQAELGLVAARHRYQIVRASLEALVGREL
ncbi:MAG: TolC family protein, partial [Gemmatimonadetes bacterium]|nr:TolC family protein [Gemmatimonadota bacterium]